MTDSDAASLQAVEKLTLETRLEAFEDEPQRFAFLEAHAKAGSE